MSTPTNKSHRLWPPVATLLRAHWLALAIVGGLLVLYALAGFFLVPHVARAQLTAYVTQTLQRRVSLGELKFNPFTFVAQVSDFTLSEADGSPIAAFKRLLVDAELSSVWQRAVHLQALRWDAPNVRLVIERDGAINLAKLVPASTEPSQRSSATLPIRIDNLAVSEGRMSFTDLSRAKPFTATVAPIRFSLANFRTEANYQNAYRFSGVTDARERLEWSGAFTVSPLGSTGQFQIVDLKAKTLDSYLQDALPLKLVDGSATLAGSYQVALDPKLALEIELPAMGVKGLQLADRRDLKHVPIALPTIEVRNVALSYAKRSVDVGELALADARVDLVKQRDGVIDLVRMMQGESQAGPQPVAMSSAQASNQEQHPATHAAAAPWAVRLNTFRLQNGSVTAEDRSVTPVARFVLQPANLVVTGVSSDPAAKMTIDGDVRWNERGRIAIQGDVQLEPLTADLNCDVSDVDLVAVQPYLATATAVTLHSGVLGAKGKLHLASGAEALQLKYAGDAHIAKLRISDRLVNEDLLKWRDLALTGIAFEHNPDRLSIERIVASEPYAKVVISQNRQLNVSVALQPAQAATAVAAAPDAANTESLAPAATSTASAPMPINIKMVRVERGAANFADYSIQPSFAAGIVDLNGTITALSSRNGSRAKVLLDGKVDRYAPVHISGEANLLAAQKYSDIAMNFQNLELTTFNPYSGRFAGYNIVKGKLSTELKYHVEDRKLAAEHHIVVDNIEFGEATGSKEAVSLPIRFAVSLLKNRNGIIDVNLPVSGSLDDPHFKLGPIIWKAVVGLVTKIATAPFALIGSLFGGGEELSYVDFPAGSAELPATETAKLAKLTQALIDRPQLKLEIPTTAMPERDAQALARAAFVARVPEAATPADTDDAKRKRIKRLAAVYKEVAGSAVPEPPETQSADKENYDSKVAELEGLIIKQLAPSEDALNQLGRSRAAVVQNEFLKSGAIEPARVYITNTRAAVPGAADFARMTLKLE